MSADDFLDGLKADWQSRTVDTQALAEKVQAGEQRLARAKRHRLASLAGFILLIALFGYCAWRIGNPLFHLGAIAFLAAALLLLGELLLLRRVTGADLMADSLTLLGQAERQARSALRLEQAAIGGAIVLWGCAAAAMSFVVLGRVAPWQAIPLALVWAIVGGAQWVRQRERSAQAQAELDQIQALRSGPDQAVPAGD